MRLWLQSIWAPVFNAGALFSFLTIPFFIFFVYVFAGEKGVMDRSETMAATTFAIIFTLPVWALLQAVLLPFRAFNAERTLGEWQSDRFVYRQPMHVLTTQWVPDNNGQFQKFSIPGVPVGALVDYKIEVDGPADRINCVVFGAYYISPAASLLTSVQFALNGRVVVKKSGSLDLLCHSLPSTVPAIVRVFVLGWQIDPDVLLDYTDVRKDVRFVLGPPDAKASSEEAAAKPTSSAV